jgi:hypothetical protein
MTPHTNHHSSDPLLSVPARPTTPADTPPDSWTARDRGTDAPALADSLMRQILSITEARGEAESEELCQALSASYEGMKAGGGRDFEEFARDFEVRVVTRAYEEMRAGGGMDFEEFVRERRTAREDRRPSETERFE